jgi:hypothetical protein
MEPKWTSNLVEFVHHPLRICFGQGIVMTASKILKKKKKIDRT